MKNEAGKCPFHHFIDRRVYSPFSPQNSEPLHRTELSVQLRNKTAEMAERFCGATTLPISGKSRPRANRKCIKNGNDARNGRFQPM